MKLYKLTALTLTAVLAAISVAGCGQKTKKIEPAHQQSSQIVYDDAEHIGENKIKANLLETVSANDTVFTLKSVISPDNMEDEGCNYIYFDVTIKNNSSTAYTLSTLNNFYLIMPDGTEVYSDIRTQLFAMSRFKENTYFSDPFEIPANGEFSGIVGGFLLDKNAESFTVGFFPTKDSPRAKGDVMLIDVAASDIKAPDASIMK